MPRSAPVALLLALTLIAAACGSEPEDTGGTTRGNTADGTAGETAAGSDQPFHPDGFTGFPDEPPNDLYDPVRAGEDLPDGFRQLLGRDDIFPVYVPTFRTGDRIDWPDQELVIGVNLAGEARAYPVGFLNRREIVVDLHRGIPTFVTW